VDEFRTEAAIFFFFRYRVQTGSDAHPATYPMRTGVKRSGY